MSMFPYTSLCCRMCHSILNLFCIINFIAKIYIPPYPSTSTQSPPPTTTILSLTSPSLQCTTIEYHFVATTIIVSIVPLCCLHAHNRREDQVPTLHFIVGDGIVATVMPNPLTTVALYIDPNPLFLSTFIDLHYMLQPKHSPLLYESVKGGL